MIVDTTLGAVADSLGYELRLQPKAGRTAADAALAERSGGRSPSDDLLALAGSEFGTVLADPPWRFQNRTGKVAPEHRRLSRYDTMTTAAVCALPVPEVVAANAHLYLWVPNALIADGLRVMASWGFGYKSNLVWAKRRKDGGPDGRGVGFYFRNVSELILFGVRGQMRTLPPGRRQVNMIETRKREHSRKPDVNRPGFCGGSVYWCPTGSRSVCRAAWAASNSAGGRSPRWLWRRWWLCQCTQARVASSTSPTARRGPPAGPRMSSVL